MKKVIKLTENNLRSIISESIKSILNESSSHYSMENDLFDGFDEIFETQNNELSDVDTKVTILYDYDEGYEPDYIINIPGMPDSAEFIKAECSPQQIQQISAITGLSEEEINSKVSEYVSYYWERYYEEDAIEHAKYQNEPIY